MTKDTHQPSDYLLETEATAQSEQAESREFSAL
jgi:hypothetical protein